MVQEARTTLRQFSFFPSFSVSFNSSYGKSTDLYHIIDLFCEKADIYSILIYSAQRARDDYYYATVPLYSTNRVCEFFRLYHGQRIHDGLESLVR